MRGWRRRAEGGVPGWRTDMKAVHPTDIRPPKAWHDPDLLTRIARAGSGRMQARLHRSYWLFFAVRQWLWRHVTPAGALLFWVMLAAGSFADTAQTMAHQVFGLLFSVLVGGLLWVRRPRKCVAVERSLPRQASVGTSFAYRIEVRNLSGRGLRNLQFWEGVPDPRPTLAEFVSLEEPGESRRNWFDRRYRFYRWAWLCARNLRARVSPRPLPWLPPHGQASMTVEMVPLRRGRLVFAGAEIARTDPFGLFCRLSPVRDAGGAVTVLPRRFRLPDMPLPGRDRRLHAGGVALAGSVGDSEEFISVRDYRAGDPLRRIHWSGWARTQRPVVKEFQEEFFVRHALLLDTFGGGAEAEAFEDAVSLAASFASTVDQRDSLLDLMFLGDKAYVFTAGRGLAHAEQMLEILAAVELHPDGDPGALEPLVLLHAGRLSGCILILLKWDELRRRLRERLEALHLPTLTFIIHRDARPTDVELPGGVRWFQAGKVESELAR